MNACLALSCSSLCAQGNLYGTLTHTHTQTHRQRPTTRNCAKITHRLVRQMTTVTPRVHAHTNIHTQKHSGRKLLIICILGWRGVHVPADRRMLHRACENVNTSACGSLMCWPRHYAASCKCRQSRPVRVATRATRARRL